MVVFLLKPIHNLFQEKNKPYPNIQLQKFILKTQFSYATLLDNRFP